MVPYCNPETQSCPPEQLFTPAGSEQAEPQPLVQDVPPSYAAPGGAETTVDPEVRQSRAELFNHYTDGVCAPNAGAGGAGGAPNRDTGAEGAGGASGSGAGCQAPEEKSALPAQSEEPKAETAPEEAPGEKKSEAPANKSPSEMTLEERQADRTAKMDEYAKQTPEEKKARWAKNDGKLSPEAWAEIEKIDDKDKERRKQPMLQAGIDKLDYDDPRRAQLEKIQHWMGGENSVTPKSKPPSGESKNLLTAADRTGSGTNEEQLETSKTRCGDVANQMLNFTKDAKAPGLPGGYFGAKGCEAENATPGSGDIFHLRNEAKNGNAADDNGHASMFVVSSPDGKTWLTFDGGQGDANGDKQQIALVMRSVSMDANGRTMVSGALGPRAVSKRWDYQKMYNKYLSPPQPTQ